MTSVFVDIIKGAVLLAVLAFILVHAILFYKLMRIQKKSPEEKKHATQSF